jgi:ADP-ribose pyrophosphatase
MLKRAPEGWKLLSSKKMYDHRYLKVYEDVLDLASAGKSTKKKTYIRGVRMDYSTIVPFSADGREILTIKSYRHLVDSYQVEAPSGYIEKGETPRHAARRELEEETGYVAKKLVLVGSYTLDYTMFLQRGHIFAAYGLEKTGQVKLGAMEKISKVEFMPIEKIKKMLHSGKILNAASIVALYRALDFHEHRSGK